MITRRRLVIAIGAIPFAIPRRLRAQQKVRVRRVGFLGSRSRPTLANPDHYYALVEGLRDLGYVEGKNLAIEWRFADGAYERLPELAAELVRLNVDIIVTHGTPGGKAAQQATSTIPIVVAASADPVKSGFAASLSRPGTNLTGLSLISVDVVPKQLELLKTLRPKLTRVAFLMNPTNPVSASMLRSVEAVARTTGTKIVTVKASTPAEIDDAFAIIARERVDALVVSVDSFLITQFRRVAALSSKHRLPSLAEQRDYVASGGLMSYGQNLADFYRRAAVYVDKIFKGAKPGELPIEQPTKIHFAINRTTAKVLGITIPKELILRADEVIE